jgi:hypothetical protein
MKITINTEVLKKHKLSLGEFLVMLIGYYDIDIHDCHNCIIKKYLAEKNLFKDSSIILSDNSKNLVARILMESDERAINSGIDFEKLATELQEIFPDGIKAGKTYSWRGTVEDIAQKLRVLVVIHGFKFTPEEAISATKEYVSSYEPPYQHMHTLKNFLLFQNKGEMESIFMTIIENNR